MNFSALPKKCAVDILVEVFGGAHVMGSVALFSIAGKKNEMKTV